MGRYGAYAVTQGKIVGGPLDHANVIEISAPHTSIAQALLAMFYRSV